MRFELATVRSRAIALSISLALLAGCTYLLQRHLRAYLWSRSADAAGVTRSIELEPGNAAVLFALGRLELYSEQKPEVAAQTLLRAATLNPHSPWHWLDLATAYQSLEKQSEQMAAIDHATQADPRTPVVAWEAANLFLAIGDTSRALDRFRVVVENDPMRAPAAFRLALRATDSLDQVLTRALPSDARAYLQFIDVLISDRRTPDALHTWSTMRGKTLLPPARSTGRFLEYLLREHEGDGALKVWRDVTEDSSAFTVQPNGSVNLYDSSFEEEQLFGGFIWRIAPPRAVTIDHDSEIFRDGTRSLRFDFSGAGMQQPGLTRVIPVEPGATYELTTSIRSESLESANPPHWYVDDAFTHKAIAHGPAMMSSSAWHDSSFIFHVPASTRMVTLILFRDNPQTLIKGRLWLDNLRMVKR